MVMCAVPASGPLGSRSYTSERNASSTAGFGWVPVLTTCTDWASGRPVTVTPGTLVPPEPPPEPPEPLPGRPEDAGCVELDRVPVPADAPDPPDVPGRADDPG